MNTYYLISLRFSQYITNSKGTVINGLNLNLNRKANLIAQKIINNDLEFKYWHAISLANKGKFLESLQLFKEIFKEDPNWRILTERLPASGLLKVTDNEMQNIMSQ